MIYHPKSLRPRIVQSIFMLVWALQSDWAQADTLEVNVKDNFFQASTLHVKVGDSVKWIWQGTLNPHSTTSGTCAGSTCTPDTAENWDSGIQSTAGFTFSKSPPFTKPGTYPYYCQVHVLQGMTGKVIVDEATPPPASCLESDPVNQNPIPKAIAKDSAVTVLLQDVVSGGQGLVSPNWGISAPGDKQHLFITDTVGTLWAINLNDKSKDKVLDVSPYLVTNLGQELKDVPGYDERGLLGVAFHPKYRRNGLIYSFTSEPFVPNTADFPLRNLISGNTPDNLGVISEWKVDDPKAAHPKVSGTPRILMRIEHPELNHNGGALNFGPDGMLYISVGDGGNANDQDSIGGHNPVSGNGQDRSTVLGKILRIDPLRGTSANGQYGIPRSNPFAKKGSHGGEAGCTDANKICDEIWAYGFRNPYRFSFDIPTGNLLVADVGQNKVEEVDVVKKGRNYGWAYKEGTFFFLPNGTDGTGAGFVSGSKTCRNDAPSGLIDPVAEYDHDEGIAIVGGFVYHGKAIPSLKGHYVFGDYAKAFANADPNNGGRIFHIKGNNLRDARKSLRTITELRFKDDAPLGMSIFGFAQDAKGELYVLGNTSGVPAPRDTQGNYLETGIIKKLVPAPGTIPKPTPKPTPTPPPNRY